MILDVQGSAGIVQKTIQLEKKVTEHNYVKLKYFHFPDLPLLDQFPAGVTVSNTAHDNLPVSTIQGLVNQLDGITHNSARVMYCFYNGHEFELCTAGQAVTLEASLAAVLKMPLNLTPNTCYSSSLFENEISVYSHFAVRVGHARGFWDGSLHNEIIARIRRDRDISTAHEHFFNSPVNYLTFEVFAVKRSGTVTQFSSPEVWSVGLEFG